MPNDEFPNAIRTNRWGRNTPRGNTRSSLPCFICETTSLRGYADTRRIKDRQEADEGIEEGINLLSPSSRRPDLLNRHGIYFNYLRVFSVEYLLVAISLNDTQKKLMNIKKINIRGGPEFEFVYGNFLFMGRARVYRTSSIMEACSRGMPTEMSKTSTILRRVAPAKCGPPRCRCRRLFLEVLRHVRSIGLIPDFLI